MVGDGTGLLRAEEGARRTTFMELFFDLVYVLAVTQLTLLLVQHPTPLGAVQTLVLLLAVWWAWVDTAWVTNWFDPDRSSVRLMLVGVMLLSLVMSSALPRAYGERGLWVAGAYAAMQVGRATFAVVALGGQPGLRRNFQRILSWKVPPAVLWLAGGFVHGSARLALWIVAVAIEYVAPAAGFRTPWLGRSTPADWPISGRQLAERSQLFILIALGESILVTGAVFGARPPDAVELAALVVAFLGTIALWWIYFDRSAEAASSVIDEAGDPGRLGRSAYTYHHLPMVAGIIVAAVGDELTINHPTGHSSGVTIATVLGGPALFLAGHALFKRAVFRRYSLPRVVALGLLAALVPVGLIVPPVALSALATLVVAGVAAWDRWVIARREAA